MTRKETKRCGSKQILQGTLLREIGFIRRYFGPNVKITITPAFLGRSRSPHRHVHYRQFRKNTQSQATKLFILYIQIDEVHSVENLGGSRRNKRATIRVPEFLNRRLIPCLSSNVLLDLTLFERVLWRIQTYPISGAGTLSSLPATPPPKVDQIRVVNLLENIVSCSIVTKFTRHAALGTTHRIG